MNAMQRNAYSMVELIFVIMVLGILAVVVIPKMSASRADARAAVISKELATCIGSAGSHYMREGIFDNGISSASCDATINNYACFVVTPNNPAGTLMVKHAGISTECLEAHKNVEKTGLSSSVGVTHRF